MTLTRLALAMFLCCVPLALGAAEAPRPAPPELAQAVAAYQKGDLPQAIRLLEPLRKEAAAHPAAMALLGSAYLESGRAQDALTMLAPLADGGQAGPVVLHNAGRAALTLGQTGKAEDYFRRAAARAPASPASRDLGILLGSEGRTAESYQFLRPWAAAHPDDREVRLAAAYGAVELNRPPEAEELLASLPSDDSRARLLRGRLLILQQKPREGIAMLEPLLAQSPPGLELGARRYLAEAHLAIGESAAAVALLQGKAGSDPSLALLLGRAQYQAGDAESAAATLAPLARDAGAHEPATPEDRAFAAAVALEYGRSLVAAARWAEAVTSLERAARLDPGEAKAWQLLAQAQAAAGRSDEAARSLATFRKLQQAEKPMSQQVQQTERGVLDPTRRNLDQALTLLAQGRKEEALVQIRQEAALAPDDPRPRAAAVVALLALQRAAEARKAAADTLARPGGQGALHDLAALLASQGRMDEARALLQQILALQPGNADTAALLKKLDANAPRPSPP